MYQLIFVQLLTVIGATNSDGFGINPTAVLEPFNTREECELGLAEYVFANYPEMTIKKIPNRGVEASKFEIWPEINQTNTLQVSCVQLLISEPK